MKSDQAGLKTIAVFEALKGSIVLLAAAWFISFVHRHAGAAARIVHHLHLNPDSHYPHIFLNAAASLNSTRLWILAGGVCVYTTLRFLEAYGLWNGRRWAEWLGAISGVIYIPLEAYELFRHVTIVRTVLLLSNIAIVAYLGRIIYRHRPLE